MAQASSRTLQSWLYYREFGETSSVNDPVVNGLRQFQKAQFAQYVVIPPPKTDRASDDNPAQSLKEILEQRMEQITAAPKVASVPASFESQPYRRAIGAGVSAAILVLLLVGTIILIKSLG